MRQPKFAEPQRTPERLAINSLHCSEERIHFLQPDLERPVTR